MRAIETESRESLEAEQKKALAAFQKKQSVLNIDPAAELDPRLAGRPKREQTEMRGRAVSVPTASGEKIFYLNPP